MTEFEAESREVGATKFAVKSMPSKASARKNKVIKRKPTNARSR